MSKAIFFNSNKTEQQSNQATPANRTLAITKAWCILSLFLVSIASLRAIQKFAHLATFWSRKH